MPLDHCQMNADNYEDAAFDKRCSWAQLRTRPFKFCQKRSIAQLCLLGRGTFRGVQKCLDGTVATICIVVKLKKRL